MICPFCLTVADPAVTVLALATCEQCGGTVHIDEAGHERRATAKDLDSLTDAQTLLLVKARSARRRKR
jgi:hypothetical protein